MANSDCAEMVWRPVMEDCVFRFDTSEAARTNATVSLSFSDPSMREKTYESGGGDSEVGSAPQYVPSYALQHGQQTVELRLPTGTHFYGTGLVTGSLERTGKRVVAWNTDAWGYTPITHLLYQSHPWVVALLPDGDLLGVLADTQLRIEVDLRQSSRILFRAAAGYPVLTFGPYSHPDELMLALARAIGTCAMPAKWALGYHQCRWSYKTADRVLEVARNFRERRLPCDVIWIDIDYMNEMRPFTFNETSFPDRPGMAAALDSQGFRSVWIVDAGVKVEKGYPVFDSGDAHDCWVLSEAGETFTAPVWPGLSCWPDFTRREVRAWWAGLVREFAAAAGNGVAGICTDMNEPALFRTMPRTMPNTCIHRGDPELGGTRTHLYYHNVYGGLMASAGYDGLLQAHPDRRPFVLARAGFIGNQKFSLTWTGDNLSQWNHFEMIIPMTLNLALSSHSFTGADIGGFHGDASPALFARWMGLGVLMPFARGHSDASTKDHEPWAFGKECEDICRLALERRYRLIPHLYTLMYRAHKTGLPVMAPVFFADTKDPKLRKLDNAFLLGSILVSASVVPNKTANVESVTLPKGIWRNFDFGDQHPDLPLMHLKGGSIVATGPVLQHVSQARDTDPVDLWVALDESGVAEGILYEDAGDGFAYLKGDYLLTHYTARLDHTNTRSSSIDSSKRLVDEVVLSVDRSVGQRARSKRMLRVHLLLGESVHIVAEGIDGETIRVPLEMGLECSTQGKEITVGASGGGLKEKQAPTTTRQLLNGFYAFELQDVPSPQVETDPNHKNTLGN